MVDRANIKQMIPALPDEKIGDYAFLIRVICACNSAPPSSVICSYCLFNSYFVAIAHINPRTDCFSICHLITFDLYTFICTILQICWQLPACSNSRLLTLETSELIGSRICSKYLQLSRQKLGL